MDLAILGIDGIEPSLVAEWRDDLPTLDGLIGEGRHGRVRSSDPPFTAPAWPDIYTGKQSGKHGVFGFTTPRERSYDRVPVNHDDVRAESLWEALDHASVSCGVVNVPLSYPPTSLDHGYVVAGWPVPNRVSVTRPQRLEADLEDHLGEPYTVNPYPLNVEFDVLDDDELADRIRGGLRHRTRAIEYLLKTRDVDVFFGVFMGIDVASHNFAWNHDRLHDIYVTQDELLAEVVEHIPDDTDVMVMSDHGHGARGAWSFHVNGWLRNEDYLAMGGSGPSLLGSLGVTQQTYARLRNRLGLGDLHRRLPQPLLDFLKRHVPQDQSGSRGLDAKAVDWGETEAYSPAQNRIHINDIEKPDGVVPVEQREGLVAELTEALHEIPHPDEDRDDPLMSAVYRGDELYHGPYADAGPDVVFVADDMRCNAPMSLPAGDVITEARWGEHRQHGLLITAGPSFADDGEEAEDADIKDVFPLALALIDVDIPEDADGAIPEDRLVVDAKPSYRESRDAAGEAEAYSDKESEAIEEQLEGLGYLE